MSITIYTIDVMVPFAGIVKYDIKVICKFTLSFAPYPLCFHPLFPFQWYPQSKNILLNLSMKCWNSAFDAQGSRIIIIVVHIRAVKIYVAAVEALRKMERGGWNSVYYQNWCKKLVSVPVISFRKLSFPVMHLMPYDVENGCSRP